MEDQPITIQIVIFVVTLLGVAFGGWRWVHALVKDAKHDNARRAEAAHDKADAVGRELSTYKTHVAENFATKAGVSEQMVTLTKAVTDVGDRLDKRLDTMTDRLDRVIEGRPRRPRDSE